MISLVSGIQAVPGADPASLRSQRLVHAATEFESQMMQELLKPLSAADDGDAGPLSGSGGTLQEFASEALGTALAGQGGFGIASSIVQRLSPPGNGIGAQPVTKTGNEKPSSHSLP